MVSLRERTANLDMSDLLDEAGVEILDGEVIKKIPKDFLYSIEQVRTDFNEEGIKELAENIRENGQQAPIIVHPLDNTNKYCIHQGERRWRAICSLDDIDTVDCLIRSNNTMFQQLSENIQRENLTPYEISEAISNLKEKENIKSVEVSKKLGKSKSWMSLHESIAKMPQELVQSLKYKGVHDVNIISNIRQAANVDFEATLSYVEKMSVITREGSDRLKQKLNSASDKKRTKKLFSPTNVVVRLDEKEGFLMNGSEEALEGTVDIMVDGNIVNAAVDNITILGYAKG
ncbi:MULTISPECIES: ParB/RepB/Spo0J family partition protein [Vibrio harveyi group]|uniref:ParB/RepB/Spo0J family partition protein n=1 Tax=Vibrio harveyi group TaxID=717610 RepID=UPI00039E4364|nr:MULTISPECIES: ParB/RepB/Spo0J family partition protein [Vibrio harveyi group]MCE7732611.1 ParB/RepB/Spo0J family partition protein [Vibrio campbellii]